MALFPYLLLFLPPFALFLEQLLMLFNTFDFFFYVVIFQHLFFDT